MNPGNKIEYGCLISQAVGLKSGYQKVVQG